MLPVTTPRPNTGPVGGLRALRPLRNQRRRPRWLLLLLPLALVAVVLPQLLGDDGPGSLAESRLAGARGPAPLSVILLLDESGSFWRHRRLREHVLAELGRWAPHNLRPDDQVTVVAFGADARTRIAPVSVAAISAHGLQYLAGDVEGGTTSIRPALEEAGRVAPRGVVTTVVAITDTIVDDARPGAADALLSALTADTMTVVLPDGAHVAGDWGEMFPWEKVLTADPGSVDETTLALAHALAHATGQDLEEVR